MPKIRLLPILISLHFSCTLYGQSTFAPLGAYWNYDYSGHSGGLGSSWTIKVTHDTLIDGYQTKTLTKYYDNYYALPPYVVGPGVEYYGTLKYRNDSVFIDDDFIYHFNMGVGDTVFMDPFPLNRVYAIVDTMYSVVVDGQTLTRWDLIKYCDTSHFPGPPGSDSVSIIENIGLINDFLRGNIDGCYTGGGWSIFQCYYSDSLSYNDPCEMAYNEIAENTMDKNGWSIYPVPAQNRLHVSVQKPLTEVTLKIYNVSMQVVGQWHYTSLHNQDLDVSQFPAGTYFIQLVSGEMNTARKCLLTK